LTRQQYDNSTAALLGDSTARAKAFNPEPGSEQGFQNDAFSLRVRAAEASQFQAAARALASQTVAGDLGNITACAAQSLNDASCQTEFVGALGKRLFRRPLLDAEQQRYAELFAMGQLKRDALLGAEAVIEAMLQSPHFLYRFELGKDPVAGVVELTSWELASLLSYTFLGGPPDAELSSLAEAGALDVPATLEAQARRMLQTSAARPAAYELYRQLFELTQLPDIPKDEAVFPDFDGKRADLASSAQAFVQSVLFDEAGSSLQSLLTSKLSFVNQNLAPLFGVSGAGAVLAPVVLEEPARAGILTHPALMSVLGARTRTSPVNRGRFVREKLLCHIVPDPPEGTDTQVPPLAPALSARQQLDAKTGGEPCATCHARMNPIGFGFEKLDGVGRYRTEENGQAIDDSGSLTLTRDIDGAFQGANELATKLASSAQVHECLAVQGFRYVLGRPERGADACSIVAVRDRWVGANLDLKELLVALAGSEAYRLRSED